MQGRTLLRNLSIFCVGVSLLSPVIGFYALPFLFIGLIGLAATRSPRWPVLVALSVALAVSALAATTVITSRGGPARPPDHLVDSLVNALVGIAPWIAVGAYLLVPPRRSGAGFALAGLAILLGILSVFALEIAGSDGRTAPAWNVPDIAYVAAFLAAAALIGVSMGKRVRGRLARS